ncbi:MAG: hypothetical protein U0174_14135 [Polyangiaceae bacterium]
MKARTRPLGLCLAIAMMVACGDRSKTLGKPCGNHHDCDVGALTGVCMGSVVSSGYCTMMCEKDSDCVGNHQPAGAFVCANAEVTSKGAFSKSTQTSRYCKKAKSDLARSIENAVKRVDASAP